MKDYIETIYLLYNLILTLLINISWVIVVFYAIYWIFNLIFNLTGSYWISGIIIFFTCPMIIILGLWGLVLIVTITNLLSNTIEGKFFNDPNDILNELIKRI